MLNPKLKQLAYRCQKQIRSSFQIGTRVLPRKIGSTFCLFWLKVLLSPVFLWQIFWKSPLIKKYSHRFRKKNAGYSRAEYPIRSRRQKRPGYAPGFVLPTVMMVLLVFSLVVSSILLRTSQQTQQVAGARSTQTTYNVATPAVDRAKSKLEFLFKRDPRFRGVPGERDLERFVLNRQNPPTVPGDPWPDPYTDESGNYIDIYTLPGETRINIGGDTSVDNAWAYNTDIDGDGTTETVAYSILMRNGIDTTGDDNYDSDSDLNLNDSDSVKATNLITRTGPLTIQSGAGSSTCGIPGGRPQKGWYPINTATDRKNIQVNAVVINRNAANRTVSSVEFQQDRQVDKGNKWGVWFRYDLEAFPGPDFNWNGAMHTDGNIMWGDSASDGVGISTYLISSPNSCLYTQDASEITMSQLEDRTGRILFQGQVINTSPANNNFVGSSEVDTFPGSGVAPSTTSNPRSRQNILQMSTDSVRDNLETGSASPYNFSLDPIPLYTLDSSQSRYTSDVTNVAVRDSNWTGGNLSRRVLNKLIRRPYVDDTYRADDRWGPKPKYTDRISIPSAIRNGTIITSNVDTLTKEDPLAATPDDVGLDGYWERRARVQGLRLIVGQRLELGNAFGWMGNNDPLYPPNSTTLTNLARQRRSVRDNLAAVQSTLIYHYENGRDFPIATLASTVHPGTSVTRDNANSFRNLTDNTKVNTDFLNGVGTNGWEFNAPGNATDETAFIALIDQASDPLRIALTNLSRMAGDPLGAFPPKQEASGTIVHPYPRLNMWGDFSNLRRALSQLDAGTAYSSLSLADRTTLQTAAATIGMLSHNLNNAKVVYDAAVADTGATAAGLVDLGTQLWRLMDGDTTNGEVNQLINPPVAFPTGYVRNTGATAFYGQFTPEQFIEALTNSTTTNNIPIADVPTGRRAKLLERARQIANYRQIERDRTFGFVNTRLLPPISLTLNDTVWNGVTGDVSAGSGASTAIFKTYCDPDVYADGIISSSVVANQQIERDRRTGLAVAFCGIANLTNTEPKYPALYYLFPKQNHDQIGNNFDAAGTLVVNLTDDQPNTEEYIGDLNIFNADPTVTTDINHGFIYRVIRDTDANGLENGIENGILELVLEPRVRTTSGTGGTPTPPAGGAVTLWKLPFSTTDTLTGNRINDNGTPVYLAFMDKALHNGRQLLQERVLDVDLNLIRSTLVNPSGTTSDFWMSQSGIIYAFREDALREDGIERPRPAGKTFTDCDTEAELVVETSGTVALSSTCMMGTSPTTPQDPPVSGTSGISTKPVDFYTDPDRRSHGFRLKNGADVSRVGTDAGFSFISDNPIYIQGDMNLHQNSSGTRFEEFTVALTDNWSNFYTRGSGGSTNGTLNINFAKPDRDRWRPVEILGDALTVLSNNFCDGTLEDGFRNTNTDCVTGANSSYRNSTLAIGNITDWQREASPTLTSTSLNSPIRIDRNGQISRNGAVFADYRALNNKTIGNATDTRMNAIFINGLVPSRPGQSYGGLHNFPRFVENWSGQDLHIAGAFVQLNFSAYATAPWEQEAWEPGTMPGTGENIGYYSPPNRRWGYDVALQYSRPGPVANRFVSVGSPRNEFYQQIPNDDPYIKQLRCGQVSGQRIDTNATDCS